VPLPIAEWLRLLVESHEAHPVPTDWRSFPRHEAAHIDRDVSHLPEQQHGDDGALTCDRDNDGLVSCEW
jgi:hypothetical protein